MKSSLKYTFTLLLVAAAYFVSAGLGLSLASMPQQITAVWPPTGIALGALLVLGPRVWPAIALGAFTINALSNEPAPVALAIAAGNTLEALAGAHLFLRIANGQRDLNRVRNVVALLAAATASTAIAASVGVASLYLGGLVRPELAASAWWLWWLGDMMGAFIVAPLFLMGSWREGLQEFRRRLPEGALFFTGLFALSCALFLHPVTVYASQLKFLIFPFMLWSVFRLGARHAVAAVLIVSVLALKGAIDNSGAFVADYINERLLLLQSFTGLLSIMMLMAGAVIAERARAERALQAIMDNTTAVIQVKDRAGRFLLVNRQWEILNRLSREDVTGHAVAEVYPAEAAEKLAANDRQIIAMGHGMQIEERVPHPAGVRVYISNKFPLLDSSGRAYAVCGIATDITERKQRESRAAVQYDAIRLMAEATDFKQCGAAILKLICDSLERDAGAIWLVDETERVLRCAQFYAAQPSKCTAFERASRELSLEKGIGLPGRIWASAQPAWIPDVTQEANFPRAPAAASAGLHTAFGFPIKVGARVHGVLEFFHHAPSPPDDDLMALMSATGIQIGHLLERRNAEQASVVSEARIRAILDSALDCVITIDHRGCVLEWNPAAERTFGYTRAEAVGREMAELIVPPDQRPPHRAGLAHYMATGEGPLLGKRLELKALRKDGTQFPVELAITRVATGGPPVFTGYLRDITERKESLARERAARLQAEAANRAKDEFLAVVSHELRTPLTPILGWTRMLRTGHLDAAQTAHALETLERNVRAQGQLVEDLLDISRIVAGKLNLDMKPIMLASVVRAAIDTVRPAADAKKIDLRIALDEDLGLLGDFDRLQQVVWNLLANAIKFTSSGGWVEIKLKCAAESVELTVSDNGQGIKAEYLPHMFNRFSQADSSTTRAHGGLGLGLAIVRHIVELHGGRVSAQSPGKGQGATFSVSLPIAASRERAGDTGPRYSTPAAGTEAIKLLSGLSVMVVDDEPDTRAFVAAALQQWGARVSSLGSVAEALEAFEELHPDLLISDIGMPGEDGYTLIRKLRALSPAQGGNTPAIALTAYARAEDRDRILSEGYQMHVPKPVDPLELATVVANVVRRR